MRHGRICESNYLINRSRSNDGAAGCSSKTYHHQPCRLTSSKLHPSLHPACRRATSENLRRRLCKRRNRSLLRSVGKVPATGHLATTFLLGLHAQKVRRALHRGNGPPLSDACHDSPWWTVACGGTCCNLQRHSNWTLPSRAKRVGITSWPKSLYRLGPAADSDISVHDHAGDVAFQPERTSS